MRVLAFDTETSGLDPKVDRIIEVGAALWDTDRRAVLWAGGWIVRAPLVGLSKKTTQLTGLVASDLEEFGLGIEPVLRAVASRAEKHSVGYMVAHNAPFDRSFLIAELGRTKPADTDILLTLPWIDTQEDLPFNPIPDSRKLKHLLAERGIINPCPHRAQYDALGCLLLLKDFPFDVIEKRSAAPRVTLQSKHPFELNEVAKLELGFNWKGKDDGWRWSGPDFEVPSLIERYGELLPPTAKLLKVA